MKDQPVIIIKKRAPAHHAHHGGAWKVAYADFVTALMAFFLVMWIVGQSNPMKAGVAGYFRDPGVFDRGKGDSTGLLPGAPQGIQPPSPAPTDETVVAARAVLERAADRLRQAFEQLPEFANIRDRIEIQVTSEGLRIELVDDLNESFFQVGRAELRPETIEALRVIADELAKLPNPIAVEGHTDSRAFAGGGYGNWELSSERANAARRAMETGGLEPGQIVEVRGFADRMLHFKEDPLDPRNRRVSIVVRNVS
ncbi:MAG TPA: flagellar motor protein MotB [Vicinamibacterales bacterium]